jgi:MFS family permease
MQRYSWTNNRQPIFWPALPGRCIANGVLVQMVDVLAAPQQAKTDSALRTLAAISTRIGSAISICWCCRCCFPFLKAQLGVGYIELGFALTVFAVVSGLTQAPIGYLADHIGARKILLIGLTVGGLALIMLGLHLSYPWLIASAVLLGLANSVYHPADYAILSAHMDEARMGRAFSIHTFAGFLGGAVAPAIVAALVAWRRPRRADRGRRGRAAGGAAAGGGRHSRCQRRRSQGRWRAGAASKASSRRPSSC